MKGTPEVRLDVKLKKGKKCASGCDFLKDDAYLVCGITYDGDCPSHL